MAHALLISDLRTKQKYAGVSMELADEINLCFPSRWSLGPKSHAEIVSELDRLAKILNKGCEAIAGVYMRMCDRIRQSTLVDSEIREILSPHFPQSRISEILRVSRAPEEIYSRYSAGFFGFKAALKQCRLYQITPGEELKRRAVRRAAQRLINLLANETTVRVKDRTITIS